MILLPLRKPRKRPFELRMYARMPDQISQGSQRRHSLTHLADTLAHHDNQQGPEIRGSMLASPCRIQEPELNAEVIHCENIDNTE